MNDKPIEQVWLITNAEAGHRVQHVLKGLSRDSAIEEAKKYASTCEGTWCLLGITAAFRGVKPPPVEVEELSIESC